MKVFIAKILIVLALSLGVTIHAQTDDFLWAVRAGGTTFDHAETITLDESGNAIITGFFTGSANFGNTTLNSAGPLSDVFVAKCDHNGNFLWARQAGGTGVDEGVAVATDGADNIICTGAFSGTATFGDTILTSSASDDIFIAKYSANGDLLWARSDGGTQLDRAQGVATDGSGDCLVTGYFSETAAFGDSTFVSDGQFDIFLAKYDANGNFLWAQQAGGQFFDEGKGIATDAQGNVIITGKFSGTAVFGDTSLTSNRLFNTFVAKYDTDGNFLWARKAGGRDDFAYGIATDQLGNSIVTGYFQQTGNFDGTFLTSAGSGDIYVAKYDDNGSLLWVRQAGGSDLDQGFGIATDNAGNVVVSGFFVGNATFGDTTLNSTSKDIFIAKYGVDGNFIRAVQAGGSASDEGRGIAVDNSGNAFIAGLFEGTASFAGTALNSDGETDIFVAQWGPGGLTAIAAEGDAPRAFHLFQNYPNPFNPTTTISYSMQQTGEVELTLFNTSGQIVRTLENGHKSAGEYSVAWDGRDDSGRLLSSGPYFYRLTIGEAVLSRRMLFLK